MNIKEEAVIALLATCPGEFRNILFAKTRVGKPPHKEFHDLSGKEPEKAAQGLQTALRAAGYDLPELGNVESLCFKLLKTIQKHRKTTEDVATMLGSYDPVYGEDGDHPPEEEGKELLKMVQTYGGDKSLRK